MKFEFDVNKSAENKAKHGIDFVEAQMVWLDSNAISGPGIMKDGESRWLKVGKIGEKLWTVCYSERGDDTVRIISARRSRQDEREAYEG